MSKRRERINTVEADVAALVHATHEGDEALIARELLRGAADLLRRLEGEPGSNNRGGVQVGRAAEALAVLLVTL